MKNVDRWLFRVVGVAFLGLIVLMSICLVINICNPTMPSDNEIKAFCLLENSDYVESDLLGKDEV